MKAEDFSSLAASLERAQADAMVELAVEARPVADGWMTFGGPGAFVNKACGLGLAGPVPPEAVEQMLAFFRSRGAEPRGIPTERNATRLGFRMAYTRAILVRPGEGLVPSP